MHGCGSQKVNPKQKNVWFLALMTLSLGTLQFAHTFGTLQLQTWKKQEDREVIRSGWTSTYTVLVVRMCGLPQHAPVTSVRPTEIEHPRTSQIRSVHFRNVSSVPTCFGKSRGLSGGGVIEIIGL